MAQADQALVEIESGVLSYTAELLTNSGDNQTFTFSEDVVSIANDPTIMQNGLIVGTGVVSAGSGSDNVQNAAFTAYLTGIYRTFAADSSVAIIRTAVGAPFSKHSIVAYMDGATPAIKSIAGVGHASAHSMTRGADGGPPLIGVEEIELGQVWTTSEVSAPIAASEIHTGGSYEERSDYPAFEVNPIGKGLSAETVGEMNAYVVLSSALPLVHTGPSSKRVYATYDAPEFATLSKCTGFKPPVETVSTSSTQIYGGTISNSSKSMSGGTFTQYLNDGVTDAIFNADGGARVLRFHPDKDKTPYLLCVGTVSAAPEYPADSNIMAAVSFSPISDFKTARFTG